LNENDLRMACRGAIALLVLGLASLASRGCFSALVPEHFRVVVTAPGKDFARMTGLTWTDSAKVLLARDTFGGLKNDGEFVLVFQAQSSTIEGWLAGRPSGAGWRDASQYPAALSRSEFAWSRVNGPKDLSPPFDRPRVRCAARGDPDWHRGSMLLLDPRSGRAWLFHWKT
jgi:hypothetical protein